MKFDSNDVKKTASGIWGKIESTMKEVYDVSMKAFETTADYGKIGIKKVELKILNSTAQQYLTQLGSLTYKILQEEKRENMNLEDKVVKELIDKINEVEAEIDKKEAEIEAIKAEEEEENKQLEK